MTSLTFDGVFASLVGIVSDALRVDPATITPDTNLLIDLNAESIDLLDIRFRIEEAYGFHVDQRDFVVAIAGSATPADARTLMTMRRLTEFILARKGGPS